MFYINSWVKFVQIFHILAFYRLISYWKYEFKSLFFIFEIYDKPAFLMVWISIINC